MKIESAGNAMIAEVDEIREAQVVHVQAGDLLVLVAERALSEESIANLVENLKPHIPDGVHVVVLEQSHFEVIRSEEIS